MDFSTLSVELAVQFLILMLIGMGPKIALVPFIEETSGLSRDDQRRVAGRMVRVAVVAALVIFATGALLMRLLHISDGAVAIAGGIVFLLLALRMVDSPGGGKHSEGVERDPDKLAVYPLAVPYLFNPVGITVLLIASEGAKTVSVVGFVVAVIALVGALDWLVFRNIHVIESRLRPAGRTVSEVVFGILLAAVAVQLIYGGLVRFGIVEGAAH